MNHDLPMELDRSESIKVRVVFSPSSLGTHQATLSISSSDSRESVKLIPLSGEGLDSTTGLPDHTETHSAELVAYPNPFTDQLKVSFKLPGYEFVTLEILDITGRLVYSSSAPAALPPLKVKEP